MLEQISYRGGNRDYRLSKGDADLVVTANVGLRVLRSMERICFMKSR
jgi:hypothetical protein